MSNNYTLEIRQGKSSILIVRLLGEITDIIKYNASMFEPGTEFIITKGDNLQKEDDK